MANENVIHTNDELFKCNICNRGFRSKRGLNQHQRVCKDSSMEENLITVSTSENESPQIEIGFKWGEFDGKEINKNFDFVYEKVVFWRKNLFMLPTGRAGKKFIDEITRLLHCWVDKSALADVAFKAIMIMPNLLLQKPSKTSKAKDHFNALERRMELWESGDVLALYKESETIQKAFTKTSTSKKDINHISKKFANLMQKGNVNAAIKLLSNNMHNGILPLNEATIELLRQKHPSKQEASCSVLLPDNPEDIHPIQFESIDGDIVRKAVTKTRGGSGPSSLDADGWRKILLSNNHGEAPKDLCTAIAKVCKRLCTETCNSLMPFLACRLIPLDKKPGLRPIGVGEVLRRIIGKVVIYSLKTDVMSSVGSLQVCAGQEAGGEAAVHAMREIYEDENTEAILLVDASNAFNSVNRKAFLHNIKVICPSIATFVINCYTTPSRLFVIGGYELSSEEGTTQGDPISMAVYAIATIPLILMLLEIIMNGPNDSVKEVAYADDLTAGGKISDLKVWWDKLRTIGPKFGYFPQPEKSYLIVKQDIVKHAESTFKDANIKITVNGKRHLGAVIGTEEFKVEYLNEKIQIWSEEIKALSQIAKIEPQAAFSCFVSGYKHKLNHIMRTIPNISEIIRPIDDIVTQEFIPAITGGIICSQHIRKLLSLPAKLGGLGLPIFSDIADIEYQNSMNVTRQLKENIINQERIYQVDDKVKSLKFKIKTEKLIRNTKTLEKLKENMNENEKKLNEINNESTASIWLTSLPLLDEGYVVDKQTFWDSLRIRYGWQLTRLPQECVCSAKFNIEHALTCKKGGFVTLRHNEIRDVTAAMLNVVCKNVSTEPILQTLTGENFNYATANSRDDARLDIKARGFWVTGQTAFFDVRVFNPLAARYRDTDLNKCYLQNEKEKKRHYNERVLNVEHGSFTPIVLSANGGVGREGEKFYSRLAEMISQKRKTHYSIVAAWVKRKISFSLVRSVMLCVRGSRSMSPNVNINSGITNDITTSEQMSNIEQ